MTESLKQILIKGVVARVEEVRERYESTDCSKDIVERNIVLDYENECECLEDFMSIEEYCDDKDNSIGWCWIEDPIVSEVVGE